MNYYPRYPGHYVAKTLHLTMEQDGAYTRLLDWCYLNERAIPHEARYAIARAMTAGERKAVDAMLAEFFTREGEGWANERASDEIAAAQPKIAAARANGRRGGRPKNPVGTQEKPTGFSAETQSEPSAKAPQSPLDQELQDTSCLDAGASDDVKPVVVDPPPPPPADPIWHTGLSFLTRKGIPQKQARSFLGKFKQAVGDITAAGLLAQAEAEDITDPVPWLSARANAKGASNANPVRLSAAERVRAYAVQGELADQRDGFGSDGHAHLVGSDG